MSVHAKIDPIFHAWYTYIKKIYKKKIKVKIAIEKFWCVKYYKAQPYNMEHTLCVCVMILNISNYICILPKYVWKL